MTRKKMDPRPRDKKLAPISDSLPLDARGQRLQGAPASHKCRECRMIVTEAGGHKMDCSTGRAERAQAPRVMTEAEAFALPQFLPLPDVHVAVSPEAIDQQLAQAATVTVEHRNPHGRVAYVDTVPAPVPAVVLPVGKRGDKGFVWELDAMWTERVEKMAAVAGLTPQGYLDSLLRRAWVGLDQRHRGRL